MLGSVHGANAELHQSASGSVPLDRERLFEEYEAARDQQLQAQVIDDTAWQGPIGVRIRANIVSEISAC